MNLKYNIRIFVALILFISISCDGTLGGFDTVRFPISKKRLEVAFDSLYSKYPEYLIPQKWEENNNWSKRGYGFLDSRLLYFKNAPEEMYYISFIGDQQTFKDTTHIDIAIRSVFIGSKNNWIEADNFNEQDKSKIQARFKNEIISKLEELTNSKSKDLD